MISYRIAIAFVLAASTFAVAAEVPITGVEYKLRLVPDRVSDDGRKALWAFLGANDKDDKEVSQKKCRLVQFLDVAGDYMQGAGFIVRHRAKLAKDVCPAAIPGTIPDKDRDLTLKFRSRDGKRAEIESKAAWMKVGEDPKFEQDVGIASAGDGRLVVERMFSASTKVEADAPTTVHALRTVFPGVLAPLVDDVALSAGCRRIFEESWEWEPKSGARLPAKVDLTSWYSISKDGKKSDKPVVAELSFKADVGNKESTASAVALMDWLVRTIDPKWLALGGSKTEAAAACAGD